jgi:hypothetical protein
MLEKYDEHNGNEMIQLTRDARLSEGLWLAVRAGKQSESRK